MKLGLFLLELFDLGFHFSSQNQIVHFCMLFHLPSQGFKFVGELLFISNNFIIFFRQLHKFLLQLYHFLAKGAKFTFVVLQAHFVLFKLSEKGFQLVLLDSGPLQGLLHLVVGDFEFSDFLFIFLGLFVDLLDFGLVFLDKFEVIPCDLIVVVFQLCEGLLMIFDEFVYVEIFPFFQFMNVHF